MIKSPTASARGIRREEQFARRQAAVTALVTLIRESGIKPGCIVEFETGKAVPFWAVATLRGNRMFLRSLDLSETVDRSVPFAGDPPKLALKLVYTPTPGFVPPASLYLPCFRKGDETVAGWAKRMGDQIPASAKYTNEYGEFWKREVVMPLLPARPEE